VTHSGHARFLRNRAEVLRAEILALVTEPPGSCADLQDNAQRIFNAAEKLCDVEDELFVSLAMAMAEVEA
jgi:hypothetical protein